MAERTAEPHHESELNQHQPEHHILLLQQALSNNSKDDSVAEAVASLPITTTTETTATTITPTTAAAADDASTVHTHSGPTSLDPVTSQEAAVAAVAAFASSFNDTTADDIQALTKALTTPIAQIEAEERAAAAAAAAAAVAASVAASAATVDHSIIAKTDISTPAFDVNNVYNQVLSSIASQAQTTTTITDGKRTAQEAFEQTQAAQALQLIALSLGSVSANTTSTTAEPAATTTHVDSTVGHHTGDGEGAVPGTVDPLLSITEAISNFQRQTEEHTQLDDDTTAIAQAVLLATQAAVSKGLYFSNCV
ncbi:MAG: hypothetical protein J3R72DRAFT_119821 [Linnemannia gamsii]|nr:MAG: hypothetical protein J3R72DRAFT_119821 [Linnemannia gamsii]